MDDRAPSEKKIDADSDAFGMINIIDPPEEHPPDLATVSAKKNSSWIPFSMARNYGLICKNQKTKG